MSKTVDLDGACRAILAAVIRQAVEDAQAGRPCNGSCKGGAHACQAEALRFLRGPVCKDMLTWLDLDPGEVQPALIAHAQGRPPRPGGRPARQLGLWVWASEHGRPPAAARGTP